jgi:hypothetical protein
MQNIIPIYYSEYGRYISRFRAIPSYIDALIPAERRLLLTLHEVAQKDEKSAKVVGSALGNYHPHGDTSCYGTLVNLANQGFAIGQGNWGSPGLRDAPAAHYRYTEIRLEKWVEDLAFEYIKFVPWDEFEYANEPLYLPCPVPLGLVGDGITTGIAFYRTVIPKYKFSDLVKRLIWLLEKGKTETVIQPNSKDCDIQEAELGDFKKILTEGTGSIIYSPHGKLEKNTIRILGRAPNDSFVRKKEDEKFGKGKRKILTDCEELFDVKLIDNSKLEMDIVVEPRRRGSDLQELGTKIWSEYLVKKTNFSCIFCDNEGKINTYGIDEILINNYNLWKYSVKLKYVDDYNKLSNRKFEFMVVQIIRYIFETYKSNLVGDIINKYHELKSAHDLSVEIDVFDIDKNLWSKEIKQINDQDIIDTCNKRSIKNLVESIIDIQKVENDLIAARSLIDNSEKNCFNFLVQLK